MAQLRSYVLSILVLLMIIECTSGETQVITQGEEAVLPCLTHNSDTKNCQRVRWMKYTAGRPTAPIIMWPKSSKTPDAQRATFDRGTRSLSLTAVVKSDEGSYSCEVCEGWDCDVVENITLKVRDCKAEESVKAATNTTAILPCPLYKTGRNARVSWIEVKGESHKLLVEHPANHDNTPIPSPRGRVRFGDITAGDASLLITSVAMGDGLWYICNVSVGQSHRCSEVKLEVNDKAEETKATASTFTTKSENTVVQDVASGESGGSLQTEVNSWVVMVASSVAGIAAVALFAGLYLRYKSHRNTDSVNIVGRPGVSTQLGDHYNNDTQWPSEDRINSLYTEPTDQEDGLCTFAALYE